jgi:hypothetical protein
MYGTSRLHIFLSWELLPLRTFVCDHSLYLTCLRNVISDIKSSLTGYAKTFCPIYLLKNYGLLTPDLSACAHWLYGIYVCLGTSFLMLLVLCNAESDVYLTVLTWVIFFSLGYFTLLQLWTRWYA